MTTLQLLLPFHPVYAGMISHLFVNTLPSTGIIYDMPAAPVWCDECGESTYHVNTNPGEVSPYYSRTLTPWHCENASMCGSCDEATHDGTCDRCECCGECCECVWCDGCNSHVGDDDYCGSCDACHSCCNCMVCTGCDRRYSENSPTYVCGECEYCDRCGCECASDDDDSETSHESTAPDGAGKMLFGVEIEFAGASIDTVRRALADHMASRYLGQSPVLAGWSVVYDGSVSSGGELKSPPTDWSAPGAYDILVAATALLKATGATTSASAGVHVHIDARDLSASQRAMVAVWSDDYADQLYRIASSGWRTMRSEGMRSYCKPIDADMADKLRAVKTNSDLNMAWYGTHHASNSHYDNSRYHGVNLHSFVTHGTVEFRVFNSTLNAARIAAYVAMSNAVVQAVRHDTMPTPTDPYSIGGMANDAIHPDDAYSAMVGPLEPYLSPTDQDRLAWCWSTSRAQRDTGRGSW